MQACRWVAGDVDRRREYRLPGKGRPVTFNPQAHDQTGGLPVPATTVVAPPWIADLPTEDRGFHLPAEVGWVDGKPRIDQNDPVRSFCLMIGKACAVCGHPLEPGGLVYRVWGDHDAKHIRDAERDRSHDDAGPVHWSCIVYSAMVCPHMSSDRSRLRKGNTMNPGVERGREAVIIGFQQTGILFPTRPTAGPGPQPMGIFNGLKKNWPYKNGRELENLYAKAVEHDTGFIDASQPRLFWTDSANDVADLRQRFVDGQQQLSQRAPDYRINVQRTAPGSPNAGLYSAYLL